MTDGRGIVTGGCGAAITGSGGAAGKVGGTTITGGEVRVLLAELFAFPRQTNAIRLRAKSSFGAFSCRFSTTALRTTSNSRRAS
jgi:hypothetical protein